MFAKLLESPGHPYRPQALFGLIQAYRTLGRPEAAAEARARLEREFPETPWAKRAREEKGGWK